MLAVRWDKFHPKGQSGWTLTAFIRSLYIVLWISILSATFIPQCWELSSAHSRLKEWDLSHTNYIGNRKNQEHFSVLFIWLKLYVSLWWADLCLQLSWWQRGYRMARSAPAIPFQSDVIHTWRPSRLELSARLSMEGKKTLGLNLEYSEVGASAYFR